MNVKAMLQENKQVKDFMNDTRNSKPLRNKMQGQYECL